MTEGSKMSVESLRALRDPETKIIDIPPSITTWWLVEGVCEADVYCSSCQGSNKCGKPVARLEIHSNKNQRVVIGVCGSHASGGPLPGADNIVIWTRT